MDWSRGAVARGGGVAATIDAIRRTRGPNKNPTREQVAIRFDGGVLSAFRASALRYNSWIRQCHASFVSLGGARLALR
jgi:hypothetical protein